MLDKRFILNADGFGITSANNQAILEGYVNGFLKSASLCANCQAFEDAIYNVLPDCPNLSLGVQLNLTKGKPLSECSLLTDCFGNFNSNFINLMFKSKNIALTKQIEQEFRMQIEKILENNITICHINSIDDIHSIPYIFEIVAKLAKEYDISYIRTHQEELYFVPKFIKHFNIRYIKNFLKLLLLNYFTSQNKLVAADFGIKTNDFIIGIGYENLMDNNTIEYGIKEINQNSLTECVIHPCKYNNSIRDSHTKEFGIILDKNLEETIKKSGFELVNFKQVK